MMRGCILIIVGLYTAGYMFDLDGKIQTWWAFPTFLLASLVITAGFWYICNSIPEDKSND
jgi:hypothetical protein